MFKLNVCTAVLILTQFFAVVVQAQTVATLTPTPFDASGDLSVAKDGEIFVANGGDPNYGSLVGEIYRVAPTGEISLFVSDFGGGAVGNAFDSKGDLFQVNVVPPRIYKITPTGDITTFTDRGRLNQPLGITLDSKGNVYVGNCLGQNVLKFTPDGEESVLFDSDPNSCPLGVATDDEDNLYVSFAHTPYIVKITPAGEATDFASTGRWTGRDSHNQHLVYAHNRLYLASEGANRVLELSMEGDVSVLAGTGREGNDDGPLLEATFTRPRGIDISPDGRKLYVTSSDPPTSTPDSWVPNLVRVIEIPGIDDDGFQINPGQAGAWFNPETPGQGQLVDVEPESKFLFLSWFTFTGANSANPNEQHWFTAQGNYTGDTADLLVYETLGGRFDDPQEVSTETVGSATLSFSDCSTGQLDYSIDSWSLQGSFPLQRAIPGTQNVCEERTGLSNEPLVPEDGLDGAWYDPASPGQGFLIDAHPGDEFIFVAWFTYGEGTASGQRWLTAQGPLQGSTADLVVYETLGGSFDKPDPSETNAVGTITIDFTDCSNALLDYSITDEALSGLINIERAIPGTETLCEELKQ